MVWRPHDTGYEPLENASSHDDVDEQLLETRKKALQEAVIDTVLDKSDPDAHAKKIERLRAMGMLDQEGDDDTIRANIMQPFQTFFARHHHDQKIPGKWNRHLFFEAAKVLVATGVLRLNTCRDWQVNRRNPAENVGLQNFNKLEDTLWQKYGEDTEKKRFYHLHSGSGDNSGVYQANNKRNKSDRTWRHVGFGNKLYAPIETLIGQFLKERYRDKQTGRATDPEVEIVIRILTEAIQKKLHEKWYSPDKGVTEDVTWAAAAEHQDLNEILTLLKNPRELLAGIDFPHAVSIHVAKYQLSGRFTGNRPMYVSDPKLAEPPEVTADNGYNPHPVPSPRDAVLGAYTTLMKISGMSSTLIEHERSKFLEADTIASLAKTRNFLTKIAKVHRGTLRGGVEPGIQYERLQTAVRELLPASVAEDAFAALNSVDWRSRIRQIVSDATDVSPENAKAALRKLASCHEIPPALDSLRQSHIEIEKEMDELLAPDVAARAKSALWYTNSLQPVMEILAESRDELQARMDWIRGKMDAGVKPESASDLEMTLPQTEAALTPHDVLLSEERTLQWTLDQIKHVRGPIPRKLRSICEEAKDNAKKVIPGFRDDEPLQAVLTKYLEHIRKNLRTDTPNPAYTHEVFTRLFEPEFVAAIEREKKKDPEPSDWTLIDATKMGADKQLRIPNIPNNAVVRAEGLQVTTEPQRVPTTDFLVHLEGNTLVIDGLDVVKGRQSVLPDYRTIDVQTAFALEVTTELDLNERPYAFLRNFVPGNFNDITRCFPHESFGLISAIRSDSHIGDEDFAKLSADYVKLLHPGGVVITDGIEESYSQVVRLIQSFPPDEAKVEVVMSNKTHRPIALMIQRAHEKGFLSDTEKSEAFQEHVYFRSPEDVANLRPDLEIRRDICNEIRTVCGHGAFKWVEEQISLDRHGSPSRLEELITAAVVGQKLNRNPKLSTPELKRSIARHIVQRNTLDAGNPQPQLITKEHEISSRIDIADPEAVMSVLPDLDRLAHKTVWSIRREILQVLDPKHEHETSDVVQAVERCIVNAFCDVEVAKLLRVEPDEVQGAERRKKTDALYDEGRNITYGKNPILTEVDIGYIQRRTADRALREIDKGEHQTDPIANPLRRTPGVIRQFRRRGDEEELPDIRTTLLRDNSQFATPEAAERLQNKVDAVRLLAKELTEATDHAPIGFVKFTDCVTNDLLEERLREILGDDADKVFEIVPCSFVTHGTTATIEDKAIFRDKIASWAAGENRLVLGGGSWENAFEPHGELLKKMLGDLFRQTLGDRNVRMFGICFFNQVLGDMVGALPPPLGTATPTKTKPGPLEAGLARITPTGDGITHPIFADCAQAFTGIMSRSGHLKGADLYEKGRCMKTLARSGSGGTAAWEAFGGKFGGIQWHPEVRCMENGQDISSDSRRVFQQIENQRNHLRESFEHEPEDLRQNFNAGRAEIKADSGKEILVNALYYQLSELRKHLVIPNSKSTK